jgi:hypothetical protein
MIEQHGTVPFSDGQSRLSSSTEDGNGRPVRPYALPCIIFGIEYSHVADFSSLAHTRQGSYTAHRSQRLELEHRRRIGLRLYNQCLWRNSGSGALPLALRFPLLMPYEPTYQQYNELGKSTP